MDYRLLISVDRLADDLFMTSAQATYHLQRLIHGHL